MPQFYWLDSNVLIEAHRRYYSFDIAPGFWASIEAHAKAGALRSPQNVLDEIAESKDALTTWAKGLGSDLFVQAAKDEQQAVGNISQYVLGAYPQPEANSFLARADPWVIAHALINQGTVVTQEVRVAANSQKVKIPNVCDQFKVPCISTYDLLRRLNVKLKS